MFSKPAEHLHVGELTICDTIQYKPDVYGTFGGPLRSDRVALGDEQFREIIFEGSCSYAPAADRDEPRLVSEIFRTLRANRGVLQGVNTDADGRQQTQWKLTRRGDVLAGGAADGRRIEVRRDMTPSTVAELLWPIAEY
jgi:hypothetical protein